MRLRSECIASELSDDIPGAPWIIFENVMLRPVKNFDMLVAYTSVYIPNDSGYTRDNVRLLLEER